MDPAQLKQVPLFANLTADHLQKVAAIAMPRILKMGEHVFREGEIGTEMYIIGTGKVRISKMVPGVGEEALRGQLALFGIKIGEAVAAEMVDSLTAAPPMIGPDFLEPEGQDDAAPIAQACGLGTHL